MHPDCDEFTIDPATGLRTVRNSFVNIAIVPDFFISNDAVHRILDLCPFVFIQLSSGLAPTRSAIVQAVTTAQALQMRKVRALKYTFPWKASICLSVVLVSGTSMTQHLSAFIHHTVHQCSKFA